jgi:hypothetical protein
MYNLPVGKFMFEFCQTSPLLLKRVEDLMDYTLNWSKKRQKAFHDKRSGAGKTHKDTADILEKL